MKALVTGCAGFIGSNLTDRLLDLGYEVIGIDCFTDYYERSIKEANISNALKNTSFKFIECDMSKMDGFPEVDYVFHLAAQAGVRASWGKSFEIYTRNNIEATQKLLEFYKYQDIQKFAYSSSSSVYGDADLPMKENSLLKPISPYGASKLAAENLCYLYWKNYNVPTVSLRYFTVYGPRQRPDMAIHKFIKAILNGDQITIYGDGTQTRSFCYVDDLIEGIFRLMMSDYHDPVNIGNPYEISILEFAELMNEISGNQGGIVTETAHRLGDDPERRRPDITRANEILGWEPKISFRDGLVKTIPYFKQKLDL